MTTYTTEYRKFEFKEMIIAQESMLDHLMQEASCMLTCLEAGDTTHVMFPDEIALEAGVVKKTAQAASSLFKRIIEFIKNIFKKFAEKVGIISKSNEKWIEDNREALSSFKDSGMEIQMTPYWNNVAKLKNVLNIIESGPYKALSSGSANESEANKYNDVEAVKNRFFKQYTDNDGKLTEGLKNLVRTGSTTKTEQKVVLTGDQLGKLVNNTFIPYVLSYKSNTLASIQKLVLTITRMAETAERTLENKQSTNVQESFCVLEGMQYGETELSHVLLTPVSEALERVESQKKINETNKKTDSPAKVEVVKHEDNEQRQHADNMREATPARVRAAKNALTVAQTVATTAMTLYEEINIAYMNALKSAVDEMSKKKSKSDASKIEDTKNQVASNSI